VCILHFGKEPQKIIRVNPLNPRYQRAYYIL
jgi:hypothetical protein